MKYFFTALHDRPTAAAGMRNKAMFFKLYSQFPAQTFDALEHVVVVGAGPI